MKMTFAYIFKISFFKKQNDLVKTLKTVDFLKRTTEPIFVFSMDSKKDMDV